MICSYDGEGNPYDCVYEYADFVLEIEELPILPKFTDRYMTLTLTADATEDFLLHGHWGTGEYVIIGDTWHIPNMTINALLCKGYIENAVIDGTFDVNLSMGVELVNCTFDGAVTFTNCNIISNACTYNGTVTSVNANITYI